MIIKAKDKRKRLRKELPWVNKKIAQVWTVDREYTPFTPDELVEAVKKYSQSHLPFIPEAGDCDDFGIQLYASVKRLQRELCELTGDRSVLDFGFLLGIHNKYKVHCSCLAETTEGIRYIEPQNDEITETYNGKIFFTFF